MSDLAEFLHWALRIKNTGVGVVECALDLAQHPEVVLRRIARIAELATSAARSCSTGMK